MARLSLRMILKTINESYHGGECRIDENLPPGERGDTLADFLASEVREVCQGKSNAAEMLDAAKRSVGRAVAELESVFDALEEL